MPLVSKIQYPLYTIMSVSSISSRYPEIEGSTLYTYSLILTTSNRNIKGESISTKSDRVRELLSGEYDDGAGGCQEREWRGRCMLHKQLIPLAEDSIQVLTRIKLLKGLGTLLLTHLEFEARRRRSGRDVERTSSAWMICMIFISN